MNNGNDFKVEAKARIWREDGQRTTTVLWIN